MIYIQRMHETMKRLYEVAKEKYGISGQSDLAKKLNQSPQSLNNWEARGMSKAGILLASKALNISATWLETGISQPVDIFSKRHEEMISNQAVFIDEQSDFVGVKRAEFKLSAGITGYAIEYINGDRAPIVFRRDWLEKRGYDPLKLCAIEVTGSSMENSLYEGDIVVINMADNKEVDGEVYAINYEGELVIKRLKRDSGEWWLVSDNQDKRRYADKRCDESTFLIGRVVNKQSERV